MSIPIALPGSDAVPSRQRLAQVIPRRPKVGVLVSILLSLIFASLYAPVVLVDRWIDAPIIEGRAAPLTVRVPAFSGYQDPALAWRGGGVLLQRGEIVDAEHAEAADAVRAATPHGPAPFYAYVAIALALTLLYTLHLGRTNRGRLLRVQIVHLSIVLGACIATKIALMLTPMSVLVVPVSLAAVVPTLTYDRTVGLATGVWASILVSFLVPFDVGVSTVLVVQAAAAALLIPERHRHPWRLALIAGVVAATASALTYGAFHYLAYGAAPFRELLHPAQSGWAAAAIGGLVGAFASVPLIPLYQLLCGEITQASLIRHEDLSHPLLKQIAEKAPGTWQHSLAMANMAEIAANAIGANGRFVRVGAYFHDLGKSLQSKYFIENLESGEPSPHDRLPPEVSCDAIFAHVTEGIALARRHKLPERIIDFMHMHHGNGVLEYFWSKCQEQGNPKHLVVEAFRYPGVPPQSRETAILAIVDAVEAASRTLKKPDDKAVASLVQRIVYGKLHLGQLDESGLSMADLRKISDSLRETIKHAHHGRIEYPWQREQAQQAAMEGDSAVAETVSARPAAARAVTSTGKFDEPRLDSLDAPRPLWRARPSFDSANAPHSPSLTTNGRGEDVAIATTQTSGQQPAVEPSASAPMAAATDAVMTVPAIPAPAWPQPAMIVEDEGDEVAVAASSSPGIVVPPPPAEIIPEPPPPPRPSSSGRAETAPDPRWVQGLAARVDAWLSDEGEGEVEMTVEPQAPPPRAHTIEEEPTSVKRGPNTAEIAALSNAFVAQPEPEPDAPAFVEQDTGVHRTGRRSSPPPPPRAGSRSRPPPTAEVDVDAIEATIDLTPSVQPSPTGAVMGPPPATKPNRTGAMPVIRDDTAPARPATSMLPPRVRRGRRDE
ncbi:MAG TPA: HDIG domain-containing protein [Kofleriaceae bacterium]|nr:HDIG domain-containing protein [Kofleriaceae bacterium]